MDAVGDRTQIEARSSFNGRKQQVERKPRARESEIALFRNSAEMVRVAAPPAFGDFSQAAGVICAVPHTERRALWMN
jgi:hypothetical protein